MKLNILILLFASLLLIVGCDNGDDDTFTGNSSSTVTLTVDGPGGVGGTAFITPPTGVAATVPSGVPYVFTTTVNNVSSVGGFFSATLDTSTGTTNHDGLSVSFTPLTPVAPGVFESTGTVSGGFPGDGTVTMTLTYREDELEIISAFFITVGTGGGGGGCTPTLSFAPASPGATTVGIDLPITAMGTPPGGMYSTAGFVDTGTGGSFTAIDAATGAFTFTGSATAGSATIDVTYDASAVDATCAPVTVTYTVNVSAPAVTLSFCSGPLTDVISDAAPVASTITVASGTTSITDLRLLLDISHTFTGDLDITLTSPALTVIDVTSDNGGGGDDMGVIFDDAAGASITTFAGSPGNPTPFPCFTPESPLSTFDTEDANGDWILTVTDDAGGDSGTLNSWCLAFNGDTTLVPACPAGPVLAFSSGALADVISDALPVASTITVAGSTVSIADVRVLVDISHTFTGDIDMGLTSPALTVIALAMDNGGGGDDMGVIFDDAAGASITTFAGTPGNPTPFPSFTPVSALSGFDTQDANGDWILGIVDDAGGDSGTLNSWALEFDGDTSIF